MAERKVISKRSVVDPSKVGQRRPAGTGRVYLGTKDADWKCTSCGHGMITGNIKVCPACGNPKDSSEPAQSPSPSRPFLTTEEMNKRGVDRNHGSNEECPYCQSRVAPKTQVCPQCGANIENVGKTDRICPSCKRETNDASCPSCGTLTISKVTFAAREQYPPTRASSGLSHQAPPAQNALPTWIIILIFIAIIATISLCIGGIASYFFTPRIHTGIVHSSSWTCEVPRAENQYVLKGSWDSNIPSGGDYVREYDKVHHHDQVYVRTDRVCKDEYEVVGTKTESYTEEVCKTESVYSHTEETCYDDDTCDYEDIYEDEETCWDETKTKEVDVYGYVEHCNNVNIYKDEPVYQTWYEYNIWEWVSVQPATSSGNDSAISCPVVQKSETLKQNGDVSVTCSTTFQIEDKTFPYKPDCTNEFSRYTAGSVWQITISGNSITKVEYLP